MMLSSSGPADETAAPQKIHRSHQPQEPEIVRHESRHPCSALCRNCVDYWLFSMFDVEAQLDLAQSFSSRHAMGKAVLSNCLRKGLRSMTHDS